MKSIKKLGVALALAVSCLVAAPVTPLEGPAETRLEATADLRWGYEVKGGVLCTPRRCNPKPFEPTICCNIIVFE